MKKELKNLRHVIFWTAYAQDPEVLREMGNLMGGSKDRDSEENMVCVVYFSVLIHSLNHSNSMVAS